MQVLQPKDWPQPRGFSHGIVAEGRQVFVAGQIGQTPDKAVDPDFAAQTRQALLNTQAVLAEAGATPQQITRMTWFVTDKRDYLAAGREIGKAWKEILGAHLPAITLVEVKGLLDDRAKIEIESTAVIPVQK
jgi:enamine deaminase RidA (YjgF/YER057c/UK114 family)